MVKPRCAPGVCFRDDMCIETAEGVECGPCPDGYTGDGFNCDDVDEVKLKFILVVLDPDEKQCELTGVHSKEYTQIHLDVTE